MISAFAAAMSLLAATSGPAEEAQALLEHIAESDGSPGVQAAVVIDGELVWSGWTGMADLEHGVPIGERTRMRIGSVSKPITAALSLRLAESGRLDLDADVRALVPELTAPDGGVITARHLAAHTGGVRQYDFANYLDANNVFFHATLSEALARYAGDPLLGAPGERHEYSSLGYNILGVQAERAGEAEFAVLLAQDVTGPLGLSDTLIDHPLAVIERRTRFYTRFPDGTTRNTIWRDSSDYYPSGGLLSSARDLAVFTDAVWSGEWLSPASMALISTEAATNDGSPTGYSFGWQVVRGEDGAVLHYEHGGETNGAYAFVRYYPASGMSVAGIVNANQMGGRPVFFEVIGEDLPALFR